MKGRKDGRKQGRQHHSLSVFRKNAPLSPPLPSGNPGDSTLAKEPQKKKPSTRRQRRFWLWLSLMPLTSGWASILMLNGNKTKGKNRSVVNEVWGSQPRFHSSLWAEHHCSILPSQEAHPGALGRLQLLMSGANVVSHTASCCLPRPQVAESDVAATESTEVDSGHCTSPTLTEH